MREMGKFKITMDLVQEWGEEVEEGAVYGVTLHREPAQLPPEPEDSPLSQGCVQYRTCKVRRLKAATLERLVAELLDPGCQEPNYKHMFLSMYQAFSSTSTLVALLFHRDDLLSELDNADCQESALLPLIQTWLAEYSSDFWDPPQYHALRLLSAHLVHRPCFRRLTKRASELLKKFQEEESHLQEAAVLLQEPEASGSRGTRELKPSWDSSEDHVNFMQCPIRDIAEQLTRFDVELFTKVVPFQCLGCVWSQRDKKENLAPTVRATVAQFNAVTNWVITSLLCQAVGVASPSHHSMPGSTHRARVIEKWISVAQECRRLKNFSSLKAILSALQSNAIYRLKKTWAAVGREYVATFENLCETFPDENCVLTNREILVEEESHSAQEDAIPGPHKLCPQQMGLTGGVVPYLGTYLTVLTMLDTALPDTVEGGLINFEKRRREFEILAQIRQFQQSCSWYSLPQHQQVVVWLQGCKLLSDQDSYELSQELEPPVDTCPSPPISWSHRLLSRKLASLLTMGDGSNSKAHADQISVSSSGSSSSEMEDLSSPQSSPRRVKSLSSSCHGEADASPSSGSPCSLGSSTQPESLGCSPSSSSASSASSTSSGSSADTRRAPRHQHCASVTSLPLYNRQVDDSCIVRISLEYANNGNMYKSILLTSQDKTDQVIQRALRKHSLECVSFHDFSLIQLLPNDKELRVPDKANVFYAMCTSANYDFVLRRKWRSHLKPLTCVSTSRARKGRHHAK